MIPYFQYNTIIIGPIHLQVWGMFVSAGLIVALLFAYRLTQKNLLSKQVILDLSIWAIVGGLIMGRIFHVVFYEPVYYLANPLDILKFWMGGASSLGGFVGAALAVYLFTRLRKFSLKEILPYLDIAALSLWLGWAIGRLGCFFIHDHIGKISDFFLTVNFPGGARHDLGLYDSLLALTLFFSYWLIFKLLAKWHWGMVAICSFMDYAIVRFLLDFLRADNTMTGGDVRYYNLTPAQWGMMILFASLASVLIIMIKKNKCKKIVCK